MSDDPKASSVGTRNEIIEECARVGWEASMNGAPVGYAIRMLKGSAAPAVRGRPDVADFIKRADEYIQRSHAVEALGLLTDALSIIEGGSYAPAAEPAVQAKQEDGWCPDCKGSGTVKGMSYGHGPDDYEIDVDCPKCGGTGAGVVH